MNFEDKCSIKLDCRAPSILFQCSRRDSQQYNTVQSDLY